MMSYVTRGIVMLSLLMASLGSDEARLHFCGRGLPPSFVAFPKFPHGYPLVN
jgi:hypothetical protein